MDDFDFDFFDYASSYDTPMADTSSWWNGGDVVAPADTSNWWDDFDFGGGAGDSFSTEGAADDSMWDFGGSDTGMSRSFGGGGAAPTGSGYYDEITGEFVQDENGGLRGPLTNETSGNLDSMKDWTADPKTGTWSNSATGETFKSDPWDPLASGRSGLDIMKSAGAQPGNWLSKLGSVIGKAPAQPTPQGGAVGSKAAQAPAEASKPAATGGVVAPKYNFLEGISTMLPVQTLAQMMSQRG